MSGQTECSVCLSEFVEPHMLNCGHTFCLRCIQSVRAHSPSDASCPQCRRIISTWIPNYALINDGHDGEEQSVSDTMHINGKKKFAIHDNSGSMKYNRDASILKFHHDGTIQSCNSKYRFEEANQRMEMIVSQTIEDGEEITVYLLNPISNNEDYEYLEDVDYVTIYPENYEEKKPILQRLLNSNNIYGRTPLGARLRKITQNINNIIKSQNNRNLGKWTIIINTDGEPDYRREFESELKTLIRSVPCILVFNLITDEEHIVQYYNDLDVNLNKGLEEMTPVVDILDDFVSEAKEVRGANPWLVYSYSIHKRRMAGTDHMVYDMMDEDGLSLFYANILIKLILKRNDIPDIDDASYFPFLDELAKQNIEYDILSNKMVPFINVNALRRKYIYEKMIIEIKKNYVMILSILVVLFILLLPLCI